MAATAIAKRARGRRSPRGRARFGATGSQRSVTSAMLVLAGLNVFASEGETIGGRVVSIPQRLVAVGVAGVGLSIVGHSAPGLAKGIAWLTVLGYIVQNPRSIAAGVSTLVGPGGRRASAGRTRPRDRNETTTPNAQAGRERERVRQ